MSFEEFVAERLDALLRYATVLSCDPHRAQDVVQEVMLRAQVRWSRIGAMDNPGAYVKRMVTNEYLSWWRRAKRELALTDRPEETTDPMARYDTRDAMIDGISRLPRKQRAAIVLRYYENCADDEIAEMLGCSVSTVRSHISRAVSTLRVSAIATGDRL